MNAINFLRSSPDERSGNRNIAYWAVNIAALLLWCLGLGLVCLYFAAAPTPQWSALLISYVKAPLLFILNMLPPFLIAGMCWMAFGRIWAAILGSGLVMLGTSFVNFYKIALRNDPFLAADVLLVSEAANMTGEYEIRLTAAVLLSIVAAIAAVVFSAYLLRAKPEPRVRIAVLLVLALMSGWLVSNVYFDDDLYTELENIDRNAWFMSRWSDRDQYISRGFIYPFIHSAKTAVEKAPDGYDKGESAAYLASFEDSDIPQDKKVNIIAIMLEAYNDFSKFGTLEFGTDPYEYFHSLQSEALHGELVTNIFAGGTIDTERSFVTGYSFMSQYRGSLPTYVSYLKDQGYYAEGGHPGFDWFYNRRNVAEYFGFDNYWFREDRYAMEGDAIMNDPEFFADLLELYRSHNESRGDPYFSFSVTYQNHGPYADTFLYDGEHVYAKNLGYSDEAYRILNNYLWGINLTDSALRDLIEPLREDDEPVVVVLFGDHNPWLGDNSYVYDEIGISLDRGTEEGFYNYYSTPYIVWANDAAKAVTGGSFEGEGGDFSPCFLMNRLFEELGWEGSAYMKAANELKSAFDVVNRSGIYRHADTGQLTTYLEGEAKDAYSRFERLEYYMKKDY